MDFFFQKIINYFIKKNIIFYRVFYRIFFAVFKNFLKGPFILDFEKYKFLAYSEKKELSRWMIKNLKVWDFQKIIKIKSILENTKSLFIDCGSNFGAYSISISALCKNTKVMSFDASLKSIQRLKENIHLNKLEKIEAFNVGVGNVNSEVYFNDEDSDYKNTGSYRFGKSAHSRLVKVISLDHFFRNENLNFYKNIIIKLDIEGYEFHALLGMKNIIKSYKPIFFIEISRMLLKSDNFSEANFKKFILDNDLKFLTVKGKKVSLNTVFKKLRILEKKRDTIGDFFLVDKNFFFDSNGLENQSN